MYSTFYQALQALYECKHVLFLNNLQWSQRDKINIRKKNGKNWMNQNKVQEQYVCSFEGWVIWNGKKAFRQEAKINQCLKKNMAVHSLSQEVLCFFPFALSYPSHRIRFKLFKRVLSHLHLFPMEREPREPSNDWKFCGWEMSISGGGKQSEEYNYNIVYKALPQEHTILEQERFPGRHNSFFSFLYSLTFITTHYLTSHS